MSVGRRDPKLAVGALFLGIIFALVGATGNTTNSFFGAKTLYTCFVIIFIYIFIIIALYKFFFGKKKEEAIVKIEKSECELTLEELIEWRNEENLNISDEEIREIAGEPDLNDVIEKESLSEKTMTWIFFIVTVAFCLWITNAMLLTTSSNPIDEIKFLKNVVLDVVTQQIETDNPKKILVNERNEQLYNQYINNIYPIYFSKVSNNYKNIAVVNFFEKVMPQDSEIEIQYYKNTKIIKAIIINGQIYNDTEQIEEAYYDYIQKERQQAEAEKLAKLVNLQYPQLDLYITEIDNESRYNTNPVKLYNITYNGEIQSARVWNVIRGNIPLKYNVYDLNGVYLIEAPLIDGRTLWQFTFELGKQEFLTAFVEFTPEQEAIIKNYPCIQVKKEEL